MRAVGIVMLAWSAFAAGAVLSVMLTLSLPGVCR